MPESIVHKNMRDGLIEILVGANSYAIKYEQGTLQLNVPGPSISVYRDRGRFADALHGEPAARYNEDQPMTGSFTAYLRDFSDATYITAPEFILKSGLYLASWGSVTTTGEVKLVDLRWTVAGIIHTDPADHVALMKWVNLTGAIAEGDPDMTTINFESFDLYPAVS